MAANLRKIYTFDVELTSEPWDTEVSASDGLSKSDALREFDRQFFGGWECLLHAEHWSLEVPDTDSFVGLGVGESGTVPFENSGYVVKEIEDTHLGAWRITVVSKAWLVLSIEAPNLVSAKSKCKELAQRVFAIGDEPIETVKLLTESHAVSSKDN